MDKLDPHHSITFVSAIVVLVLIVASSEDLHLKMSDPTGNIVAPQFERPTTYAYNLNHWMQDFFGVPSASFPECACTDIAKEIGQILEKQALQVTEDFTTHGPQRVSSVVFGIEQEFAGGLEMVYGKDLVNKPGQDSAINLLVETVVRLPRLERSGGVEMTVYGVTKDLLYVNAGRIRTPMLDCSFARKADNKCDCFCITGRTTEYINE